MDGRGRFADNIFVERPLAQSQVRGGLPQSLRKTWPKARQGITAYFEFYNYQRLHQALLTAPPRQVFDEAAPLASSRAGEKRWRTPNTISTLRCKPGQDFLTLRSPDRCLEDRVHLRLLHMYETIRLRPEFAPRT